MNYIKQLEQTNKEKLEVIDNACKRLQEFRAFLLTDKFTGISADGSRLDWIATNDVDRMLQEVHDLLFHF